MKGKREFNENQRNDLIQQAGQAANQAEYFYGELSGWATKYKKYDSAGLSGKAKSYFEGLDSTLEKSKDDIDKIFSAAEEVENEYAEKFASVAFEMGLYADRINALLSVLQPVVPLASGVNPFAAADFGQRLAKAKNDMVEKEILALIANPDKLEPWDVANRDCQAYVDFISAKYRGQDMFDFTDTNAISEVERDLLVKCYEYLYPENAKIMIDFLKPVSKGGNHDDEVQCIKYLAYASPGPYHSVFFKYLPKVNITEHHQSGTQYFNVGFFGGKNIYVDVGRVIYLDRYGNPAPSDPVSPGGYATFFHEIGHAIDSLMGIASPALDVAITGDVRDAFRADIESRYPSPRSKQDQDDIDAILDSLMAKAHPMPSTGNAARDTFANQVRVDTINYFNNTVLFGGANSTASDVYGGVTDNKVHGTWGHYPDKKGKSYWVDKGHKPSSEFFADAFSRNMTGYTDAVNSININLPQASKAFTDMINAAK